MKKEKPINVVSLTDWHYPLIDTKAIDVAIRFCGWKQPEIIIIHEAHDCYSLSKYEQDPVKTNKLQEEIDGVTKYFWALRKVCPRSRIILLNSNHLERLRKYLWRQAPALSGLRSLEVENLLQLSEYNIEYMEAFEYKGVLFKHGDVVRKFAGYTAKGEFEKEGMSGVTGHTHRLGCYYHTNRGGKYVWVESGCLCDLNPEYIKGTANWQQGISMVTFYGKDRDSYHAQVLPIVNGKLFFGDIIFE